MIAGDTSEPLFADWETFLRDPEQEWSGLWSIVAGRAQSLVDDFPTAAAMVKARLLRVHGPHGLRFRSLYQQDNAPDTTDAEVQKRREIELAIQVASKNIDAGGTLSRAEMDWCISWNACVLGDGFAVRVWQPIPGIETSTRWRIINPARVAPPGRYAMDPKYQGGIEIDDNGRPAALWVIVDKKTSGGVYTLPEPVRVPWYAPDGTRNVVHKVGLRRPGSRRGLSEFAPIMLPARMLQGVDIAYVTMKRVQASHPMLIKVDDLKAAREQYRGTRIGNLLIGKNHEVTLPPFKFEGADYREFVDTTLRGICAAWQIPWELVLGDHSARSGAASRSLWQQHYQMAEREQAQHVEQVQAPMDESLLREAVAVGKLTLSDQWGRNTMGVYQGPPKVMPDPGKEIDWAAGAVALGMSKSTVFARMGEDYRDETMQVRQDDALAEAQGVDEPEDEAPEQTTQAPATTSQPADDEEDADEPQDAPDQPDTAEPGDASAMRAIHTSRRRIGSPDMNASQFAQIMSAINMSQRTQPIINANITLPESVVATMAPPTVNVAAPNVTINPQPITVEAPNVTVSAPHVTVEAAEPAAPASVVVNVSPTPVTVENTVEVPSRTIKATPQRDGSVLMVPQG